MSHMLENLQIFRLNFRQSSNINMMKNTHANGALKSCGRLGCKVILQIFQVILFYIRITEMKYNLRNLNKPHTYILLF